MPGAHEESQKYQYNVELSWQISHHNCGDFYQRGSCCLIIILLNNQYTELLGETEKHSVVVMSENKTPDIKTGTLEETIYVGRRPIRSGSFCQPERFFMEEERQFQYPCLLFRLTPSVSLPKRSQSFRSCLKKPATTISVPEPESG